MDRGLLPYRVASSRQDARRLPLTEEHQGHNAMNLAKESVKNTYPLCTVCEDSSLLFGHGALKL